MKNLLIAAALGATAVGGIAYATQSATTSTAAKPLKGDSDGNGSISRAEFVARAESRFAKLDANRDGKLTRDEGRAGKHRRGGAGMGERGARGERMLARVDTDGDGRISRAESDARAAKAFVRVDANGDGYLDAAERAARRGRRDAPMPAPTPSGG